MKNLTLLLATITLFLASSSLQAQVRVKKGDIKVLKGQKRIGVKFTYDNMSVGKFKNEKDYIKKKVADYNEKEAGRGDSWKEAWENDRSTLFEPKFLDLITKYADKKNPIQFSDDTDGTKYTMIVNTDFTEPGFNIMIARKNAEIRTTITIVETANPKKVLAVISAGGQGRTFGGYDWETGTRVSEAYAKTGKEVGKYLAKKAFK